MIPAAVDTSKFKRYRCKGCALITLDAWKIKTHARSTGHAWETIPWLTPEEMAKESAKTMITPDEWEREKERIRAKAAKAGRQSPV